MYDLAADANDDEVEPIDLWEEEEEAEPKVHSLISFNPLYLKTHTTHL